MKKLIWIVLLFSPWAMARAQSPDAGEAKLIAAGWQPVVYKQAGDLELRLWVLEPASPEARAPRSAVVLFFGGGWQGRNMAHFQGQGEFLVEHGMVAILPDYRAERRYGGTPFECVEDAKSAMRYVRAQASRWQIDPQRIAAGGGSAGGHLAIATACLSGFNAASDDLAVSCIPDALVLFNPVYDNGPEGYGYDRIGERYQEFSPLHNLRTDMPPTVVFFGTDDVYVPVGTINAFQARMKELGNDCRTHLFDEGKHGFFNEEPYFSETLGLTESFLRTHGFIE